jgi:peroxin-7
MFSPHHPDLLATCSTDGTVKLFDTREPSYVTGPNVNNFTQPMTAAALTIPASPTEVLSVDWNKYRSFVIASGGVDKVAKVWDCRMVRPGEVNKVGGVSESQLLGHEYAIRKLQWSPHKADILATSSYDMTCRV